MIALGITGRSGCGKSTVTAVFSAHGVPLADADQLSREILLPGSPLLPQLAARFGGDILKPDGTLDQPGTYGYLRREDVTLWLGAEPVFSPCQPVV